jgi:hypothetical protein
MVDVSGRASSSSQVPSSDLSLKRPTCGTEGADGGRVLVLLVLGRGPQMPVLRC